MDNKLKLTTYSKSTAQAFFLHHSSEGITISSFEKNQNSDLRSTASRVPSPNSKLPTHFFHLPMSPTSISPSQRHDFLHQPSRSRPAHHPPTTPSQQTNHPSPNANGQPPKRPSCPAKTYLRPHKKKPCPPTSFPPSPPNRSPPSDTPPSPPKTQPTAPTATSASAPPSSSAPSPPLTPRTPSSSRGLMSKTQPTRSVPAPRESHWEKPSRGRRRLEIW